MHPYPSGLPQWQEGGAPVLEMEYHQQSGRCDRAPPPLCIVMSAYNAEQSLALSLPALMATTTSVYELIVVLDDCHDASLASAARAIERSFGRSSCCRVRVVRLSASAYETSAQNLGMRMSNATEAYVLTHPDIILAQHGWDVQLRRALAAKSDLFALSGRCAHSFEALYSSRHRSPVQWARARKSFVGRCFGGSIEGFLPASKGAGNSDASTTVHIRDTANRGPLLLHARRTRMLGFLDETHLVQANVVCTSIVMFTK